MTNSPWLPLVRAGTRAAPGTCTRTALAQEPTDIPACKELTAGDQCPSSVEGINTALTCRYNSACTRPGGPVGCWGATGCQYYDVNPCKALTQPGQCPAALPGINTALDCVYNEKCMSPGGPVGCWGATGCQYYTPPTPATALVQEPTNVSACVELTPGAQCPSSVEGINTALTCRYNSACTRPGGPVGCWGATGCQYYDVNPCKALTQPGQCPAALPGINTALDCVYNEKCMSPGGPVGCWGATGCQYYTPTPATVLAQEPATAACKCHGRPAT